MDDLPPLVGPEGGVTPEAEGDQLILGILEKAIGSFRDEFAFIRRRAMAADKEDNGVLLHDAWILSLYRAFVSAYPSAPEITVFAKPLKTMKEANTKIPYGRGEYGFDLAVVRMSCENAPYHKRNQAWTQVPVVESHLWQVESEMRGDATKLAEDLGKLTGGAAPNKLLVGCMPRREDTAPWLEFIRKAARHVSGTLFVAMVRNYEGEKGRLAWLNEPIEMKVFRYMREGPALSPIGTIHRPTATATG